MSKTSDSNYYLTGQLLVAMPSMGDNRFDKAVILVCVHDEKGAMGLVLNSEMQDVDFAELMEQLELTSEYPGEPEDIMDLPVMKGGPVEEARGFLLHSNDFEQSDTVTVRDDYKVSGSVDALREVLRGKGPDKMMFILGYSGWGPGQLDQELTSNAWLTVEPDSELIFETDPRAMWEKAIKRLGISPSALSSHSGQA